MKFTVVGGGTAGWMTAATLNKAYPDSTIIVYESPDTPATGVGESTTQFFRYWLNYIGLKESWEDMHPDRVKERENSTDKDLFGNDIEENYYMGDRGC